MYVLNLKKICRNRNITVSELALKSGIPQPSLSRYISGRSDITLRQLNRLSSALGAGLSELLQKKDKEWVSKVSWDLRKHYLNTGKK